MLPARTLLLTPLIAGLLLGLGAIALLHGVSRGTVATETAESESAVQTPEAAVAAFVRSSGAAYAGPCEATRSPEDIGKVCSRQIEQRGDTVAYLTGRTFSEFSTWVFVRREAAGWRVAGSAPLDFHDQAMSIPWPR